jgi:pyridoxamine 5'-phosphate oxidase
MTSPDPLLRFQQALADARLSEPTDATAMSLATADARGRPSARMVLLKGVDARGFVFFTNYESRKAVELRENPFAALCVHWAVAQRQIRAEGPVEVLSGDESDAYFATRSSGSQIGAWASRQSAPLASRGDLEERVRAALARFGAGPIPRPPFWGGYRLVPERVEFWSGREDRLHDRETYERAGDAWRLGRLFP